MAVDPFNAVGGYTVGIPPVPVIDSNGNLTVQQANIGNVYIAGDQVVVGNVTANVFSGTFTGNISGNIVVPGQDQQIIYNNNGQAGADSGFTYDYANGGPVTVLTDFVANSVTIGSGTNEFATTRVYTYTTASSATDQLLHQIDGLTISAMDYTIIATDAISNNRQVTKLFASVLGTEVGYYEIGSIDVPRTGPGVGDFKVDYDNGNVILTVSPYTSNFTTYKVMIISYKE